MKKNIVFMISLILIALFVVTACDSTNKEASISNSNNIETKPAVEIIAYTTRCFYQDSFAHSFRVKLLWKESYFLREANELSRAYIRYKLSTDTDGEYHYPTPIGTILTTNDNKEEYSSFAPNTYVYFGFEYYDVQRPVFDKKITIEVYYVEATSLYPPTTTKIVLDSYTLDLIPLSSND